MAKSRRQELFDYVNSGNLRYHLEAKSGGLSEEALNLLVDIALRYCETPRKRKIKK